MKLKANADHEMIRGIQDIQMDIADDKKHIIMNMLRSAIYSNPVESFVRELISNACDAHTRAGKSDVPFDIEVPTIEEPHFMVRDYGLSMTPDIIDKVYSKMGSSDKSDSNNEIGAFGIGAASPLAYSSIFYIETYTCENEQIIYRKWAQYIDSTKMGKLTLQIEEPAPDTPTGTRITVPVEIVKDHLRVQYATVLYTQHLKVRPNILNTELDYDRSVPKYKGENWAWYITDYYRSGNKCKAIVGGVPYPISADVLNQLKSKGNSYKYDLAGIEALLNQSVHLYFGVGEVDLSGSREQLQYTEKTIAALIAGFNQLKEDMILLMSCKLVSTPNVYQAGIKWWNEVPSQVQDLLEIIGFTWNSVALKKRLAFPHKAVEIREYAYGRKSYYDRTEVLKSKVQTSFACYEHPKGAQIFFNDLTTKRLHSDYISYVLEKENLDTVYVITPEEPTEFKLSEDDVQTYGIRLASSLKKALPPTVKKERVYGFVDGYYLPTGNVYRSRAAGFTANLETGKYKTDEGGVYFVIEDDHTVKIDVESKSSISTVSEGVLRDVLRVLDIKQPRAFRRSVLHRLEDNWVPLTKLVEDRLDDYQHQVDIQTLVNIHAEYNKLAYSIFAPLIPTLLTSEFQTLIGESSPLLKYLYESDKAYKLYDKYSNTVMRLLYFNKRILTPNSTEVDRLYNTVLSTYPLIKSMVENNVPMGKAYGKQTTAALSQYINMVDEQNKGGVKVCKTPISLPRTWAALMETQAL